MSVFRFESPQPAVRSTSWGRPIPMLLAAVLSLAVAGPASATPWDLFREIQLDDAYFGSLITDVLDLKGGQFCAAEIPCIGDGAQTCVVERVRTTSAGAFSHGADQDNESLAWNEGLLVNGPQIKFTVNVELEQTTLACANDPDCIPANCTDYPACLPEGAHSVVQFPVVFEMSTNGGQLCLAIDEIAFGIVDPSTFGELGVESEFCFNVGVPELDAQVAPLKPGATAVTWDDTQNLIALRTDYLRSSTFDPTCPTCPTSPITSSTIVAARTEAFNDFVDGNATPKAPGQEWSMLFSAEALATFAELNLRNEIAKDLDISIEPGGTVNGAYMPGHAAAFADAEVWTGEGLFECNTISIAPLWLDVAPSLSASLQELEFDIAIGWDVSASEMAWCTMIEWGPLLGAISPITYPIAMAIAGDDENAPSVPEISGAECDEIENPAIGDVQYSCTAPLPDLSVYFHGGSLKFHIVAEEHSALGWRMYGNLGGVVASPGDGQYDIDSSLDFGVGGSCSDLSIGYHGSSIVTGAVRVCDVEILDNPHGVYGIDPFVEAPGNIWEADLVFPAPGSEGCTDPDPAVLDHTCEEGELSDIASFWQLPEPMVARVTTTNGMRAYRVQPPLQATQQDMWGAALELYGAEIQCLEPIGSPGDMIGFNPEWVIDPPPFSELERPGRGVANGLRRVELVDIDVEFLRAPAGARGGLDMDSVPVVINAVALVGQGRAFQVPVSFATELDFGTSRGADGRSRLTQISEVAVDVDLTAHLPRGLRGSSFQAWLPAGTVELVTAEVDVSVLTDSGR